LAPGRLVRAVRDGRFAESLSWRWSLVETALWSRSRAAATYRRHMLGGVTFIGVTGSCGKTTTKELIAGVLGARMRGRRTPGNLTGSPYLERTVIRTRPRDGFCVAEMGLCNDGPSRFENILRLVRPTIGVVTVIGTDHYSFYRSAEGIAAEKGKLIEALPPTGTAVLNADDPLVIGMAERTRARVLTYGTGDDADVRATEVEARWPDPLAFTVTHGDEAARVTTMLHGAHLLPDVLAALAVGVAMGVPLADAAAGAGTVPPFEQRLRPEAHPDGYTLVRDDFKASLWSIPRALRFVEEAQASRKVVVIGTISDFPGKSDKAYASVAREAREVADLVVFVGSNSSKALKARRHDGDEAVQAFYSREVAAEFLRDELRAGDLVLIKSSESDRLDLLVDALRTPATGPRTVDPPSSGGRVQVVAGLGNPGSEFERTPHNVGHRVLDTVARTIGAEWTPLGGASVARTDGGAVCLVKPAARMNESGPDLVDLARRMGFGSADLVLVHDDLDLRIRSVRVRMRSGDAGHRGARSVLQAFRTDEIRRVRVGVGRPAPGQPVVDFVLTPFPAEVLADVDGAVLEAADRVLELIGRPERLRGRATQPTPA
jgi:aminoacyl-tRNA hydrolase